MKLLDRILAILLLLGATGHAVGSVSFYHATPIVLLWSIGTSLFGYLLGALHLVRIARTYNSRPDRALCMLCLAATVAQLLLVLTFGRLIGNFLDARVWIQTGVTVALCATSLRCLRAAPVQ